MLIPADAVQSRLAELGAQLSADYAAADLVLIGVLKGAFVVMADLARYLDVPVAFDFMAVSSYGSGTESSGVVRILKDLDADISGKDVLIVEDIIDTGLTLSYLLRNLRARKPASLEIFTLLSKPSHRQVDLGVRYVGFDVPDAFVVGFGLDYAEHYRNLPYIGTLRPEVYARQEPPGSVHG